MGMGYSAGYAEVVDSEFVVEMCPTELAGLTRTLSEYGFGFNEFCRICSTESLAENEAELVSVVLELEESLAEADAVSWAKRVIAAYVELTDAFFKITTVAGEGLQLAVGFHDSSSNGDRYDEVDGGYFCVGNVYRYSPAGERYREHINRKFYVYFG